MEKCIRRSLISDPRESLRLRSIIAATGGGKEEKDRSEYGGEESPSNHVKSTGL